MKYRAIMKESDTPCGDGTTSRLCHNEAEAMAYLTKWATYDDSEPIYGCLEPVPGATLFSDLTDALAECKQSHMREQARLKGARS